MEEVVVVTEPPPPAPAVKLTHMNVSTPNLRPCLQQWASPATSLEYSVHTGVEFEDQSNSNAWIIFIESWTGLG